MCNTDFHAYPLLLDTSNAEVNVIYIRAGMSSSLAIQLTSSLEETLGCELPATLAFDYPTVEALVEYLLADPGILPASGNDPTSESEVIHGTISTDSHLSRVVSTRATFGEAATEYGSALAVVASSLRLPGSDTLSDEKLMPSEDRYILLKLLLSIVTNLRYLHRNG